MITIAAINDNGCMVPENIDPTFIYGSVYDGTNFNFFESKEEADEYKSANTPPEIDIRLSPDYYLTREAVGKALVNDVSNGLLADYKQGRLTLPQVMAIEESLKEVIYSLRGGQFITANYKLTIAQGVPTQMRSDLAATIGGLIQAHYVL